MTEDKNEIQACEINILPVTKKIDALLKNGRAIVAIEGGSASGKTTLARFLSERYGATVFHMDDFFLTPSQRTKERLSEAGGNLDRERFESEVLIPLSRGEKIIYRPYSCKMGKIENETEILPSALVIVEGAYSTHPDLVKYYDYTVFLKIDPEKQMERIKKRNTPEQASRFFKEWIPLENTYFGKTDAKGRCDTVITV